MQLDFLDPVEALMGYALCQNDGLLFCTWSTRESTLSPGSGALCDWKKEGALSGAFGLIRYGLGTSKPHIRTRERQAPSASSSHACTV